MNFEQLQHFNKVNVRVFDKRFVFQYQREYGL